WEPNPTAIHQPQRGGPKRHATMPQSLSRVYLHIVFSTKQRKPFLENADVRERLYPYMASILRDNVDSPAILINGVEDHVHAFSVSESNVEQVKRYIANQAEHHRRMSFKDEFRELCRCHGIDWDERYVWD
ncbi:MAG: transposase, partial [Planctomycetota bacterium]